MNHRNDFPSISENEIYFDNACQSLRPKQVMDAMNEYYFKYPACGERSLNDWGNIVTQKTEEARKIIADFLSARSPSEIIFTKNTTEGINLIAHSLDFSEKNIVVTTNKEHNSNFLPWRILEEKKIIKHIILPALENGEFNLQEFEKILQRGKTRLVSLAHCSNIDGIFIPLEAIVEKSHEYGALVLIDAAQSAAHRKINVKNLDIDFLALSGHKIMGPSGTGILYGKYELLKELKPFLTGGGAVIDILDSANPVFEAPPLKFEAGLQNYAGIIGLAEAVKYIKNVGFDFINEQETKLSARLNEKIRQIQELKIINPGKTDIPLLSFHKPKTDSHQICLLLNNGFKLMTRSGQFCNHFYFNNKNIPSAVRASLAFYNAEEEINKFIDGLEKTLNILS